MCHPRCSDNAAAVAHRSHTAKVKASVRLASLETPRRPMPRAAKKLSIEQRSEESIFFSLHARRKARLVVVPIEARQDVRGAVNLAVTLYRGDLFCAGVPLEVTKIE